MEQNFFDRIIIRWNRVGEVRVLGESYLFCVTVPLIFYLLPEWIMVSGGKIHREGLFDYGLGLGAILFRGLIPLLWVVM